MKIELNFGTNKTMRPVRIDQKAVAEKRGSTAVVGTTNEDQGARRMGLQIELAMQRKRQACWSSLGAWCVTKSGSGEPPVRALLQVCERGMLEASPDLGLPATIEAFNCILKTRLARRSKHRCDAEQKACAYDLTDNVAVLMRPLENRGIVELSEGGKTELSPSTGEQLHDGGGSDRATWPAGGQSSLNRDAREHCQLDSITQNQAFNGVERIEFVSSRCNLRQVPTDRRRWSANTSPPIQNASALEDPSDSSPRRNHSDRLLDHPIVDGLCSAVAQIALGQLAAQPQNVLFGRCARSVDGPRCTRWPVTPIDPIKPRNGGAFHPSLHGLKTNVKLAGYTAQRTAAPNRPHHRTPLLLDRVLCSRAVSFFPSAYQPPIPPGNRAMESARLCKARLEAGGLPTAFGKRPRVPHPRFPQLPQPLLATRNRASRSKQINHVFTRSLTWGCWHLSDLGLVALRH